MAKIRADQRLLDQGLVDNVKTAQALIMSGIVLTINHEKILTSGQQIANDTQLYLKKADHSYVSRGGLKLKKAVDTFDLDLTNKIIVDIGSSTGGFTDVSLQEGASLVYAIDVGTNQLVWSLRNDDRVIVMEQTNFRECIKEDFTKGIPEIAVIDVSFISLKIILKTLKTILPDHKPVVALIKPQFEAKRDQVEDGGLVTDPKVHKDILLYTADFINNLGYKIEELTPSPIKGGKGNIEFISLLIQGENQEKNIVDMIEEAVEASKHI